MTRAPQALLNGRFVPATELLIPAYDAGFVLGATVSEQVRTFGGKPYRLDEHLARLRRGLRITAIDPVATTEQVASWAEELTAANHRLLDPADDLGLSIFVTPGPYPTMAPAGTDCEPTIGMSTYPLPFGLWADRYEAGERLAVSAVRQVSAESWPRELKCRSRMHYFLAEKDVRRRHPGARPLLLDELGNINETPTANVVGIDGGGLITPGREATLPGVSQHSVVELARAAGLGYREASLSPDAAKALSELWIASTPFCLLPVVRLDDAVIGDGRPGPLFKKMLEAWSTSVGVDIAGQARRFSRRGETA
jgi:branched-subunit amino acid aminotransferase/4-amino-4-deoxychorismate lyase